MDYGDIEKQTFKTYLTFSTALLALIIIFFTISSTGYRVTNIIYNELGVLNYSSLESLKGVSIWLIDDTYFEIFYEDNPTVEKITIKKELPNTLLVSIKISDKIAFIEDLRQKPTKKFVLFKNLYASEVENGEGLMQVVISNGPVKEGFREELVTFVMTLKKYTIDTSKILMEYDGVSLSLTSFETLVNLGSPSDLARKAAVVGYYLEEGACKGEIRIVYSENNEEITAITNCI
tara:strand:+ start:1664 stop:2365 length:702 start_codon:yes stop_codon:yes gene_type:complete